MTRFCPAERWLRVRMRTRPRGAGSPRKVLACSHANKTSGSRKLKKGVRMRTKPRVAGSSRKVLACSYANKTSGSRKLKKGVRVFACEQDLGELEARERCSRVRMRTRTLAGFFVKMEFFSHSLHHFYGRRGWRGHLIVFGAFGVRSPFWVSSSVVPSIFFAGFQSVMQRVSGCRSSAVSILRSSVVSGCRFFLVSVCRTLD